MQTLIVTLFITLLAFFTKLVPSDTPLYRHGVLATATAIAIADEDPLFTDDADRMKTAALVAAIEFRESTLKHDARGDHVKGVPTSFCAMQIHVSSGGSEALIDDPVLCVKTGIRLLRGSMHVDRRYPVAFYARGPRGLVGGEKREEAQRISDDRMALAKRLAAARVTTP